MVGPAYAVILAMEPRTGTRKPSRRTLTAIAVITASLTLLTACLGPTQTTALDQLNTDRRANRLSTLSVQADAQAKAQAWAEKLARENTLYHSNLPDGIHVRWCSIGENIGYGPSSGAIEAAYMASPPHHANIVNTKWNGVGIGYATNGNRVFTVQEFIKTC